MDCYEQRAALQVPDIMDKLCAELTDTLTPGGQAPDELYRWLEERYAAQALPDTHPYYARTALAVIEAFYPEETDYFPAHPEERTQAALSLLPVLRLRVRCACIEPSAQSAPLFERQRRQFEARAARFGLTWQPQPIFVCMELTTGYRMVFGSTALADALTLRSGVSRRDLDEQTPELMAYLRARHFLTQYEA